MIHLIDDALEAFLRAEVPLPAGTDVSFETPDRTWGASITRPTVNLFLWGVQRDTSAAPTYTLHREVRDDGSVVTTRPDPMVALRYLVTAWAGEHRDEHQLLGAVLRCLLSHDSVAVAHRPRALDAYGTLGVSMATSADQRSSEFWSSLDGQLKPSLEAEVLVRVPLDVGRPAGPRIDELGVGVARTDVVDDTSDPTPPPPVAAPGAVPAYGVPSALRRTRRGGRAVVEAVTTPDPPPRD